MCGRCRQNKCLNFEKSFIAYSQLAYALESKAGWKPALRSKLSASLESFGNPFLQLRHGEKFALACFDFSQTRFENSFMPIWRFHFFRRARHRAPK